MAKQTFINKIQKAREAYDEAIAEVRADTLGKHLAELIPEGFFLTWTQGTPSFNDGEPCRFSVHTPYLVTTYEVDGDYDKPVLTDRPRDMESLEDESDAGYLYLGFTSRDVRWSGTTKTKCEEIAKAFKALPKDLMEKIFGDGARVVIQHDGTVKVEDYYME